MSSEQGQTRTQTADGRRQAADKFQVPRGKANPSDYVPFLNVSGFRKSAREREVRVGGEK